MSDVALISSLTYRPEALQRATYPDYPQFTIEEIPTMLRPSQRNVSLRVHVLSLAIIAETEDDFREFLKLIKARKAALHSKEDALRGERKTADQLVKLWRTARRNGAAKAGGEATADKMEKQFWERFAVIQDRWHLKDSSASLLKEARIRHHDTVRSYLGYTRWQWRRLTDAKRARVLHQKADDLRRKAKAA